MTLLRRSSSSPAAFYYGLGWTKTAFGEAASSIALVVVVAGYVALVADRAQHPDLPLDDPTKALVTVPDFYEAARTGLHYLVPVSVLIWCLMVEEMSPGPRGLLGRRRSWRGLVLTQRPLTAFFRRERRLAAQLRERPARVLSAASRPAPATWRRSASPPRRAGIIVGTVTLTGIGLVMTEIVEFLSGGNFVIMLVLTGADLPRSSAPACRPRRATSWSRP